MDSISDKELGLHLERHLDAVIESGTPLVIKRRGKNKSVVVLPLDEFRSWQDATMYPTAPMIHDEDAVIADIKRAIKEADDPNAVWVSNEEVERLSLQDPTRWRRQSLTKRTS